MVERNRLGCVPPAFPCGEAPRCRLDSWRIPTRSAAVALASASSKSAPSGPAIGDDRRPGRLIVLAPDVVAAPFTISPFLVCCARPCRRARTRRGGDLPPAADLSPPVGRGRSVTGSVLRPGLARPIPVDMAEIPRFAWPNPLAAAGAANGAGGHERREQSPARLMPRAVAAGRGRARHGSPRGW
jgi:hypothetical protein